MLFKSDRVKEDGTPCGINEVGELYVKRKSFIYSLLEMKKKQKQFLMVNGLKQEIWPNLMKMVIIISLGEKKI